MAVLVLVNRNGTNFDEEDVNCQSNPVVSQIFHSEYAINFALGLLLSLHTKAYGNYPSTSGVKTVYVSSVHYFGPESFCILSGNAPCYVNVLGK